jgi:hypothetical protein
MVETNPKEEDRPVEWIGLKSSASAVLLISDNEDGVRLTSPRPCTCKHVNQSLLAKKRWKRIEKKKKDL